MGASADGVVECRCGRRHWGHAGAAGVLAWRDACRPEVILQLRAQWSMSGGTWGVPGGAIDYDETPIQGALREAREEAGLGVVRVWATTTLHHPDWSYTTAIAETFPGQKAIATDHESDAMEWVRWQDLHGRKLMPAFEQTLPLLDKLLGRTLLVLNSEFLDEGWEEHLVRRATLGFTIETMAPSTAENIRRGAAQARDEDYERTVSWFPDIVLIGEGPMLKAHSARGSVPATIHHVHSAKDLDTSHYQVVTTVGTTVPGGKALDPAHFNRELAKA